ncbi:MAG: ATP-binding protein [Myxococcota bacterium]|nr:ATP-binding protein [Myxococcota bacterium]
MKEIAVLSGKGGTGKTSFVAAFAKLAKKHVVLGDCDVDASNLALLIPGTDIEEAPFFAGLRARVDEDKCSLCGNCLEICRFDAITLKSNLVPQVDDLTCEGCRACSAVCPEHALTYVENRAGSLYLRETAVGPLIHACLGVAQDNSGKLVTLVRERSRTMAETRDIDTVLLDGPPGIGCPVHATLAGVNLVVAVTEPTPSGVHDLIRLLDLCVHFAIKAVVVVNKYDLNGNWSIDLERAVSDKGAAFVGAVPFHRNVTTALARGETPLAVPIVREALDRIWSYIDTC